MSASPRCLQALPALVVDDERGQWPPTFPAMRLGGPPAGTALWCCGGGLAGVMDVNPGVPKPTGRCYLVVRNPG